MLSGFGSILLLLFISGGVSIAIVLLPFFISKYITKTYRPDSEKNSPYECGFDPLITKSSKFNVKFYIVGVLFIIFDMEIAFLFPWAMMLKQIGWLGFSSMMFFLLVLTLGFVYEWKKGALEW